MKIQTIHLDEEQLIRSVVDENDLSADVRNHLSACPMCQGKKQQFERELDTLGHMAKIFAPSPRESVTYSEKPGFFEKVGFYPLLRPVLAALLIFGIILPPALLTISEEERMARLVEEMENDRQLMTEIRALEEDALPDFYQDISGEFYGYFDEEFVNFVAPMEETRIRPAGRFASSPD
ncbi:hypothetical protein QUF72_22100 [Desulfobacterales bacterium HSG2]|nr:hypothetical protein [Desulfobacterales bacterium HSG2]